MFLKFALIEMLIHLKTIMISVVVVLVVVLVVVGVRCANNSDFGLTLVIF